MAFLDSGNGYHSNPVTSNQAGIHTRLRYVVGRHIKSIYLKPFQRHNLDAFDQFLNTLDQQAFEYLILDSCCGTGLSTSTLAKRHPNALVVGIDQSFVRLNKHKPKGAMPSNTLMLQGNCEDFWRLCVYAEIEFKIHYILYPNPYPKAEHLQRRWHGHPAFPYLQALAETTVLRSNWKTYLDEFSLAWLCLTSKPFKVEEINEVVEPLTLFEQKYHQSGQSLFELSVTGRSPLALRECIRVKTPK